MKNSNNEYAETNSVSFDLEPADSERLMNLCGPVDQHLRQIETSLSVDISNRGHQFTIKGSPAEVNKAIDLVQHLYQLTGTGEEITSEGLHLHLHESTSKDSSDAEGLAIIRTKKGVIRGRGPNQNGYIRGIQRNDLTFGVGPAGTGKTYLAVACAVEALERDEVRRIILVRPAVEAGEKLGFLPGDLSQKVDPYLRPMYDALFEMMGFEKVNKLIEKQIIEVAPLAYMRGRTLNDSFIIMDEAQNTTTEQMKMFLTRLGFGSTAVVTGDVTQIDLPKHQTSGLKDVIKVLEGVEEVEFCFFESKDVVRHSLVQKIVEAYDKDDNR
ncbi:PhoH family protein [Leucothrix arctica]